jgi:hypothetical protein
MSIIQFKSQASYFFLHFKDQVSILFLMFLAFVSPVKGLIVMVIAAVALDTAMGIYKAVKMKNYESDKLFNVVVKTFFYSSTIILSYLVSKEIFEGELMGVKLLTPKLMAIFWVYIEAKSIDESSVELGHKPFNIIAKDLIKKAKGLKKDLKELKE